MYKTVSQVRAAFWSSFPEFSGEYRNTRSQNQYNATIRTAFVDFCDSLSRGGAISDSLANRVTL
jgi:hypothetical protein